MRQPGKRRDARTALRRGPVGLSALIAISLVVMSASLRSAPPGSAATVTGIHKIQHVVIIMQENHSFDSYFGTFPGATGIPMNALGAPTVCNPDPAHGSCRKPFVNHHDNQSAGPHDVSNTGQDIDGGKMDGFVAADEAVQKLQGFNDPVDVMGYETRSDIPNYWSFASSYVLQDHMFAPSLSWSLPEHLYELAGWSALCTKHNSPFTCSTATTVNTNWTNPIFAFTDITYLLKRNSISWGYYLLNGSEPDCENAEALSCAPVAQNAKTSGYWNPLPEFDTVKNDGQLGNIQTVDNFYTAAHSGTLPQVSWIVPSDSVSEHAPSSIAAGQTFVTSLVDAVMQSPDWGSTAIFVSWDDWGGYYDNVRPPVVDPSGYGFRVPGLVISPYAKKGYIDHQTLSFDAYLKFIEDDFLGGQRLDPATDGRPDPRPDVRENAGILGNLTNDFNFAQAPRPPALLPLHPVTTLVTTVPFSPSSVKATPGNGQVSIQWIHPRTGGGRPMLSYRVVPYVGNVAQTAQIAVFDPSVTKRIIGHLMNGRTFTFRVVATNANGTGYLSLASAATTVGAPVAPTGVVATPSAGSATVRWTAPTVTNGAPIVGYTVTPYAHGVARTTRTFASTATSERVTGLTPGVAYTFVVAATNSRGAGAASAASNRVTIG